MSCVELPIRTCASVPPLSPMSSRLFPLPAMLLMIPPYVCWCGGVGNPRLDGYGVLHTQARRIRNFHIIVHPIESQRFAGFPLHPGGSLDCPMVPLTRGIPGDLTVSFGRLRGNELGEDRALAPRPRGVLW